ncbi:fish-egg lectin-like [Mobula hypostoma]|uniref:fish-egg lectin-like n=1 Tax=Mobula hypostoma TaxID=723540 RepID=UPI002FC3A349
MDIKQEFCSECSDINRKFFWMGPDSAANRCQDVDGEFSQIDAGNGMVFGVDATSFVYTRVGDAWVLFPGRLRHVTVGPAGVWGVGQDMGIYRLAAGGWQNVTGEQLLQLDAGGVGTLWGVDRFGSTHCLRVVRPGPVSTGGSPAFSIQGGQMKYLSCGPQGCWGVSLADDIYHCHSACSSSCLITSWEQVSGKFQMVEVGTDGQVYAVSISNQLYMRSGITPERPTGRGWTNIQIGNLLFRHVTWDLGHLWLLTDNGRVVHCTGTDIS